MNNKPQNSVCLTKERFDEANEYYDAGLRYEEDISCLGTKTEIKGHTVHNRLACQAMEGCDGTADGEPGELTERRYLRFAEGGAGLIWFEATACTEDGRANPRQLWLRKDNADSFRRLLDRIRETAVKKNGYAPVIIMQNTHGGRQSRPHGYPEPLAAEHKAIFEGDSPLDGSRIVSDEKLDSIKEAMVENARLAEEVGFDGTDIKCCHGYLNAELLSSYSRENSRYGGSLENRSRLLRETVEEAMQVCSDKFIVTTRFDAYDGYPYPYGFGAGKDGSTEFDPEEPVKVLKELEKLGVPAVNISMGNPYYDPHVNRPFFTGTYEAPEHPVQGVSRMLNGTALLHREVPGMKYVSSALSWLGTAAPNVAAAYIKAGDFDFAGFGRMSLAYPDFANDILKNGGLDPRRCCIACSKCTEIMRSGNTPGCAVRDEYYRELYRNIKKEQEKRR